MFELLQSLPEQKAFEIFRSVRTGADAQEIVRLVTDGDLLLQATLKPESQRRYQFPYRSKMPASILVPENPYLGCRIYESSSGSSSPSSADKQDKPELDADRGPYVRPMHAAEVVEPLLQKVEIGQWTSVVLDEQVLTRLLHSYFLHLHPWNAVFHKDHFLSDMADGCTRFCSSLLVNAVLAASCLGDAFRNDYSLWLTKTLQHSYHGIPERAKFWIPQSLGYRFLAESKRLWELEIGKNRLTTVQAGIIMIHIVYANGMDKFGWSYLLRSMAIARELELSSAQVILKNREMQQVRSLTAWSLFNVQSLAS